MGPAETGVAESLNNQAGGGMGARSLLSLLLCLLTFPVINKFEGGCFCFPGMTGTSSLDRGLCPPFSEGPCGPSPAVSFSSNFLIIWRMPGTSPHDLASLARGSEAFSFQKALSPECQGIP